MLHFHPALLCLSLHKRAWWSLNQYQRTPSCHFALPRHLMAAFGAPLFTSALCDLCVFWGDELRRRWDQADAVVWGRGWRGYSLLLNTMARTHTHVRGPIGPCYFLISITRRQWGLWSPLSDRQRLPFHSSRRLEVEWYVDAHRYRTHTYKCPAFLWRHRNRRATVPEGDGGAAVCVLLLPGHGSSS